LPNGNGSTRPSSNVFLANRGGHLSWNIRADGAVGASSHKGICMSPRSIVTGAAGFIGSHLCEHLVRVGHDVTGIDCFTDYYSRATKELNIAPLLAGHRFTFLEKDLVQADIAACLAGADYVFHLAGQPGVRGSWGSQFEMYVRNNVLATQRILEVAKQASLKKLVYASSSSIYGDAEQLPTPEDVTPRPISPYGVTKLAGEYLSMLYHRSHGVPAICLRYFSVYGPRQRPDMAFHRFIQAVQSEERVTIYGDGNQTRDFTFVGDIVDGTVCAAFSDVSGRVFNLGGGSSASVRQVIEILEKIIGKRARVRHVDAQHGDARHTGADIHRAMQFLGYSPRTELSDGLRQQFEGTCAASAAT
jgi:nucleoside-diphosphate-sugar epimerase